MVIFKYMFHSYMPTTQNVSFYHANSIAVLYKVHKYQEKFESTNMDLTHVYFLIFTRFPG